VVFSRILHDLFGRLATGPRLLTLIWSDELLAEARSVLVRRKPITEQAADRWVGSLAHAFPNERVVLKPDERPASVSGGVDRGPRRRARMRACDLRACRHADHTRQTVAKALKAHGIAVRTPDEFLTVAFQDQQQVILPVLGEQAAAWAGGRPATERATRRDRACRCQEVHHRRAPGTGGVTASRGAGSVSRTSPELSSSDPYSDISVDLKVLEISRSEDPNSQRATRYEAVFGSSPKAG